jgi:co-chaperonin GroES (HSP10)
VTVAEKIVELKNKSGVYPAANRVLVKPDVIPEEVTESGIVLSVVARQQFEQAQASGELVAIGPDAFKHVTERIYHVHEGGTELFEERVRGYSEPFARVGDRISFAKYTGQVYRGKDKERYLVINDEDITAKLDNEVELSDLGHREGLGS